MPYSSIKPKFHLIRWQFYEYYREELNEKEVESAKLFFNALSLLSVEEREILADKYYRSKELSNFDTNLAAYRTVKPINDNLLADRLCISLERYRYLRKNAEESLYKAMYQITRIQFTKLEKFKLWIKDDLYFVREVPRIAFKEQKYIIGGFYEAKEFRCTDDVQLVNRLLMIGFEKVPTLSS